jgi:hypothetical protein
MKQYDESLEVWLDSDLGPAAQVGLLSQDRGQVRFRYDATSRPSACNASIASKGADASTLPR